MNWRIVSSLGEIDLQGPGERVFQPTTVIDLSPADVHRNVADLLDRPLDYPPLAQSVVPGDRVALALDPSTPAWPTVAGAIVERLEAAGVTRDTIQIVAGRAPDGQDAASLPAGVALLVHDPEHRESLAYLASTKQGTRVYLNRMLVDADVVIPVGRIGPDMALGLRGPWSTVYPDLSDQPRHYSLARGVHGMTKDRAAAVADEIGEVHWLLGSSFHVGVVPSGRGVAEIFVGAAAAVRVAGELGHKRLWTRAETADLVIAGVGVPDRAATWDELAVAVETARRRVAHGGKIVIAARLGQSPGRSLQRLSGVEQPRQFVSALRGAEFDPDYEAALALGWARTQTDMYLLSDWPDHEVADLGMTALEAPGEIDRLIARGGSCLILSRAEQIHLGDIDTP